MKPFSGTLILLSLVSLLSTSFVQDKKEKERSFLTYYAVWAIQPDHVSSSCPSIFQLIAYIQRVLYIGFSSLQSFGYQDLEEFIELAGDGTFGCTSDAIKVCMVYVCYNESPGNGTILEVLDGDYFDSDQKIVKGICAKTNIHDPVFDVLVANSLKYSIWNV